MAIYIIIGIVICALAFLVWACSTISSGVFVKAFCKLNDTPEKVVYLTFDDGPVQQTQRVLDVLARHKAKATFFFIGRNTRGYENVVIRAIAEGHVVGNHSRSHKWSFPFKSYDKMCRDLNLTTALLEAQTGTKINYFRPPFGVTNPTIGKCVRELGLTVVGWSIRTFDTKHPDPDYVLNRIKKQLEPGAVILLHDRLPQSADILEKVLCYLEENDYIFDRPLPA